MSRQYLPAFLAALLSFAPAARPAPDQPAPALTDAQRQRQPQRFAIIFNQGYAGDHLPKDLGEFEKMVVAVKEANFNVILCAYDEKRAAICQKHDMQMFVDLLVPEHHVYRNVEACRKLCEPARQSHHLRLPPVERQHCRHRRGPQPRREERAGLGSHASGLPRRLSHEQGRQRAGHGRVRLLRLPLETRRPLEKSQLRLQRGESPAGRLLPLRRREVRPRGPGQSQPRGLHHGHLHSLRAARLLMPITPAASSTRR